MPRAQSPKPKIKSNLPTRVRVPDDADNAVVTIDGCEVRLTNLRKPFWPERGITKGALIQYYADVSDVLLPHVRDRAMVMKRYPNGAAGEFFFMKRAPVPRPEWIRTCAIDHGSENVIDTPELVGTAIALDAGTSATMRGGVTSRDSATS